MVISSYIVTYPARSYLVELATEDDVSPVDVSVVDVIMNGSDEI